MSHLYIIKLFNKNSSFYLLTEKKEKNYLSIIYSIIPFNTHDKRLFLFLVNLILIFVDSDDPEAERYAPTADMNRNTMGIIDEARWKKIRSQMMYWYFDKGGDNGNGDYQTDVHSSIPQVHKNLNFQLPFFGFRYNYTRVCIKLKTNNTVNN